MVAQLLDSISDSWTYYKLSQAEDPETAGMGAGGMYVSKAIGHLTASTITKTAIEKGSLILLEQKKYVQLVSVANTCARGVKMANMCSLIPEIAGMAFDYLFPSSNPWISFVIKAATYAGISASAGPFMVAPAVVGLATYSLSHAISSGVGYLLRAWARG